MESVEIGALLGSDVAKFSDVLGNTTTSIFRGEESSSGDQKEKKEVQAEQVSHDEFSNVIISAEVLWQILSGKNHNGKETTCC